MQLQLMFYNTEYGSYENAAPKQDGLAAISVLLKARVLFLLLFHLPDVTIFYFFVCLFCSNNLLHDHFWSCFDETIKTCNCVTLLYIKANTLPN